MQTDPRVTVGLPVFNGERYLEGALRALVDQDFADLEILIADNASTDGTMAICEQFAARDPRVRILPSPTNRGIGWNHNRTVHEARGEYFKWAAYDDRYLPSFISTCVEVLDRHRDVVLCYTNTIDIDDEDRVVKRWPSTDRASGADAIDRFRDVLLHERQCFPIYGVIRTDALRSTVLLGDYSGSDHPLLAELALRGRFVEIPEALFEHREHAERSLAAYPNPRDRMVLYRPGARTRLGSPRWRMARGFGEVLARSHLPASSKLRAAPGFGSWAKRWWRPLVFEPAATVREALRQARERPAPSPTVVAGPVRQSDR